MVQKIDRHELKHLLISAFDKMSEFKCIDGLNPVLIKFNDIEFYIYIKNLSPAYFSNKDVWRVQLPIRDIFDKIKESHIPFILLGYDPDYDIFTTWNPYWTKQRLNIAQSVSFYSRRTLHNLAYKNLDFQSQDLANDGKVIAFPRTKLSEYLSKITNFFPEKTEYVAMGSKRRTDANESYKLFCNKENIDSFSKYLQKYNYAQKTIENYTQALLFLINNNCFSDYKRIFLSYDNISEYNEAIETFLKQNKIKKLNDVWHYTFSATLRAYYRYLNNIPLNNRKNVIQQNESNNESIITNDIEVEYEKEYIDSNNCLTKITNPVLIEKLRPVLNIEYPAYAGAYNIIEDFYGNRFPNMELKDWNNLFHNINWDYNNPNKVYRIERDKKRHKTHIIRVTFPNGKIICHKQVVNTFIEVIDSCNLELVSKMNIHFANINLVSKERDSRYGKFQKEIKDGWLVFTNTNTERKFSILQEISKSLELNLDIELVPIKSK